MHISAQGSDDMAQPTKGKGKGRFRASTVHHADPGPSTMPPFDYNSLTQLVKEVVSACVKEVVSTCVKEELNKVYHMFKEIKQSLQHVVSVASVQTVKEGGGQSSHSPSHLSPRNSPSKSAHNTASTSPSHSPTKDMPDNIPTVNFPPNTHGSPLNHATPNSQTKSPPSSPTMMNEDIPETENEPLTQTAATSSPISPPTIDLDPPLDPITPGSLILHPTLSHPPPPPVRPQVVDTMPLSMVPHVDVMRFLRSHSMPGLHSTHAPRGTFVPVNLPPSPNMSRVRKPRRKTSSSR